MKFYIPVPLKTGFSTLKYYCGIDLHARKMYVCILDQKGKIKFHENIKTLKVDTEI